MASCACEAEPDTKPNGNRRRALGAVTAVLAWQTMFLLALDSPGAFGQTSPGEMSVPQLVRVVTPAVVVVTAYKSAGDKIWGSGFIVDADGLVATNYHVIKDARRVVLRLSDGREVHSREIVAIDEKNDLALLTTELRGTTYVKLGDSSQVQIGERVIAFSHPFGVFDYTVSDGIVSALRANEGLLQVTAPISPGSSGGLLTNLRGEAVGVLTASVKTGQNLNFAVPVVELEWLLRRNKTLRVLRARVALLGQRALVPQWRIGSYAIYQSVSITSSESPRNTSTRVKVIRKETCGNSECYVTGPYDDRPDRKHDQELRQVELNLSNADQHGFTPPTPDYPWPLFPGRSESGTIGTYIAKDGRRDRSFQIESRVVDVEDIVVPAGKFATYRIMTTMDGRLVTEKWYSPEVGMPVKYIHYDHKTGRVLAVEELEKFER